MFSRRKLLHTLFVLALPVIVAALGWSWPAALALVLLTLLWRWSLSFLGIASPEHRDDIVLETIAASHFVEKARWCLDRLGVEYREAPSAGLIGVVFAGRTVPRINFRSGVVRSTIGNSAEILRFLWGHYSAHPDVDASFLEPTAERIELEKQFDRYGAHLQVWVYYHILPHPELTTRIWGLDDPATPWWQRVLLRPMYPLYAAFLKRTFRISEQNYNKAVERIEERLGDVETRLADGRKSLLGGDEVTFVDLTFAALSGLWMMSPNYGGGRAGSCLVARNRLPGGMQDDIERWVEDFPRATAMITRLYDEERLT